MKNVERAILLAILILAFACSVGIAQNATTYSLGLTIPQMEQRWNQCCRDLKNPGHALYIVNLKTIKTQREEFFEHMIKGTKTNILGDAALGTRMLSSLGISTWSTTPLEAVRMMMSWCFIIKVTNPSLSYTQVGEVLKKLGIEDKDSKLFEKKREAIVGQVRYTIESADSWPFFFTARDVNQPLSDPRGIDDALRNKAPLMK